MTKTEVKTLILLFAFIVGSLVLPVESKSFWQWIAVIITTKLVALWALLKLIKLAKTEE